MSNKTYDILKWIATVGLPALTAFWLTIGQIWSIPYTEPIGATLAAITTLACALRDMEGMARIIDELKGGK